MKKLVKTLLLVLFFILTTTHTQAVVYMNDDAKRGDTKKVITLTGFVDYAPIGQMRDLNYTYSPYDNIFEPLMADFANLYNLELSYIYKNNYPALVREVRSGKIDIILGIYHETKIYNGIHEYHISINTPTYKNEALKGGPHNGNGDGEASITVTASVTYKVEEIADGAVEVTIINRSTKKTPETKMCKDYTH